jgi:hypothetical protein
MRILSERQEETAIWVGQRVQLPGVEGTCVPDNVF